MPFRTRIVVVLLFVFFIAGIAEYIIQRMLIFPRFVAFENEQAREDLGRVRCALDRELSHLNSICHDWAAWNETYRFVQTRHAAYIRHNLSLERLQSSDINLLYILDRHNNVIWSKIYDPVKKQQIILKEFPSQTFGRDHPLLAFGNGATTLPNFSLVGMLMTERGPLMVASRPVLQTNNRGPIVGTMIMGRFLNAPMLRKLVMQTSVRFQFFDLEDPKLPLSKEEIKDNFQVDDPVYVQRINDDVLKIYARYPDVEGNPLFLLQVDIKRNITQKGNDLIYNAQTFYLIISLLVVIVLLFLLQKTVLNPIASLTASIMAIEKQEISSTQMSLDFHDELGIVAKEFNKMLVQVHDSAAKLAIANKRLKKDIRERKRAEKALRQSEEKYRSIINEIREGYFEITLEGAITFINDSLCKMMGYPRNEVMGINFRDFTSLKIAQKMQTLLDQLKEATRIETESFDLIMKDGTIRTVDISASPIHNQQGRITGFRGIVHDITERIMAAKKLRTQYEEMEQRVSERTATLEMMIKHNQRLAYKAEAANIAKSNFISNITHELRTPMNGILVSCDLALEEELSPQVKEYLETIKHSGDSLLGVITNLLDYSNLTAGTLDIEEHSFSLYELIEGLVEMYANRVFSKHIELLLDIEPSVPVTLIGDSIRIQQVLINLLSNAVKFTPTQGIITLGLSITAKFSEQITLLFSVKDTGIGIAKEAVETLFEPFTQQDDSSTRHYGGTGLGLTICKHLVEIMGGKIWLESEPGKGSTFYFSIPLGRLSFDKEKVLSFPEAIQHRRILLIDNITESREILRKVLDAFGFIVETTLSENILEEKLQASSVNNYDALIIHLIMPEMDGIHLASTIRNSLKLQLPVIMIADFDEEYKQHLAERLDINEIISKPVQPLSLHRALINIFSGKHLTQ